jgi:hypothetical protein
MNLERLSLLVCAALAAVGGAYAGPIPPPIPPPQTGTPSYTQDSNLLDFTNGVTNYGTFIGGNLNQYCFPCIPNLGLPEPNLSPTLTYTPTTAILTAAQYPRVVGTELTSNTTLNPIIVQFGAPISNILVFANIDHPTNWDAFQYALYGGNFDTINPSQIDFTLLFDPTGVVGSNPHFTLSSWSGTGPTLVNNALTPGAGGYSGSTGYEAYFNFGSAYQFYGFRASTFGTNNGGESESELSAVAQASATPEPATFTLFGVGLGALAVLRRRFPTHKAKSRFNGPSTSL